MYQVFDTSQFGGEFFKLVSTLRPALMEAHLFMCLAISNGPVTCLSSSGSVHARKTFSRGALMLRVNTSSRSEVGKASSVVVVVSVPFVWWLVFGCRLTPWRSPTGRAADRQVQRLVRPRMSVRTQHAQVRSNTTSPSSN